MSLEQPNTPSAWAKYAESPEIKAIPFRDLEYLRKEAVSHSNLLMMRTMLTPSENTSHSCCVPRIPLGGQDWL